MHPRDLDRVLKLVAGTDNASLVNETVLRSQSQAEYSPENIGHFGLALTKYAHFTSPIRRYADLLVHRALITGLKLGKDGLSPEDIAHVRGHRRADHRQRNAAPLWPNAIPPTAILRCICNTAWESCSPRGFPG